MENPLLDAFFTRANATVVKLPARSALAEAFHSIIKRREALMRFVTDEGLEAGNNVAENAMRKIAFRRRSHLLPDQTATANGRHPSIRLSPQHGSTV